MRHYHGTAIPAFLRPLQSKTGLVCFLPESLSGLSFISIFFQTNVVRWSVYFALFYAALLGVSHHHFAGVQCWIVFHADKRRKTNCSRHQMGRDWNFPVVASLGLLHYFSLRIPGRSYHRTNFLPLRHGHCRTGGPPHSGGCRWNCGGCQRYRSVGRKLRILYQNPARRIL